MSGSPEFGESTPMNAAPAWFTTDRLYGVRADVVPTPHVNTLYSLETMGDEDVFQYCTWETHDEVDDSREYRRERRNWWNSGHQFEYIFYKRPEEEFHRGGGINGAPILGAGYIRTDASEDGASFGVWFRPEVWGEGYSGERADAFLSIAFDHLDHGYVRAGCQHENTASIKAISRYIGRHGGAYEGTLRQHSEWDWHSFSVTREEYEDGDATSLGSRIPGVSVGDVDLPLPVGAP